MSREIKFRAWDGDYMYYQPSLHIIDGVLIKERYELMQYTGLHDGQGIEIYEGDILSYDEECRYEVEWDHHRWNFKGCLGDNLEEPEEYEVIGNIYENPELLKEDLLAQEEA